ncbi:MAG: sugar O-acyltransferase [Verrucomicrobia bacterium]|nr:MAG: sugar O-acyltransferase [Verrucomicrobiota bacterium]PYL19266.1 MAG: sugar O-acyltransferase [Verrucomicrobiota bacterium]PYL81583.1 MAG: sugar O-acyltransferase [Verrucomicrobiota bacterium]
MSKIIIFGVSQWAELAHFYLAHDSPHDVVAFTLDRDYMETDTYKKLPVVSFESVDKEFPPKEYQMFIPMSFKKMNHLRAAKYFSAKQRGYQLISYVSSKATVWPGFTCGDNCFIFEDNTIQPFVKIGNNVVMWSGNHIGHHTVIKDHVMITSHVVISGCCTIEPFCFFGVNATVRDETVIARETLVGMGVTILKDTKEFQVYKAAATEPTGFRSDQIRSLSHKSKG